MRAIEALRGVALLGLDTAPIIYYVENVAPFAPLSLPFFTAIQQGQVAAYTSAVTLTETLVHPLRSGNTLLENAYLSLLQNTQGITTVAVSQSLAIRAAALRARYNLRTPDAVQLATALETGCDAFLTNDINLKRVTEINVLVLKEIVLG